MANGVVGLVATDRTVDTTTVLTNAFDGATTTYGNPRSVVTYDGSAFWVAGSGANSTGSIWHVPFGGTLGTQIMGQSASYYPSHARACAIFADQLYAVANTNGYYGVFTVGTGVPTSPEQAALLPGFPTSTASPIDFAVLDRDPGIVDLDTIYVGDDRSNNRGGIQKWTFNGTTWTLAHTLGSGLGTGVRHLVPVESGTEVVVLAVTTSTPNSIVRVIDTGSASAITTLVTAASNTAFRGLALPPVP
ncbi:MAG: hypothetical protein JW751_18825 [Polyangiaceae bacterium]|nr:hypothetical protein [Polyangiaceae bacterium]